MFVVFLFHITMIHIDYIHPGSLKVHLTPVLTLPPLLTEAENIIATIDRFVKKLDAPFVFTSSLV